MRSVNPSQMRAAVRTLVERMDARKLGIRESEFDLLREHLRAAERLLDELDADPTHLDRIRESAVARRRAVT